MKTFLKNLKTTMIEKVLQESPNLTDRFMRAVENSHPAAQMVVKDMLEVKLFPWYESSYGAENSDKELRRAVAQQIHLALADVLFVPNEFANYHQDSEIPLTDIPGAVIYAVQDVVPAYAGEGHYDIHITLIPLKGAEAGLRIPIAMLLVNFRPVKQITLPEYNS